MLLLVGVDVGAGLLDVSLAMAVAGIAAAGAVVAALTIRPTTARGAPRLRGQHG